ncbi:hypothetical protein PAPYR_12730 [Paratrimastix pyriformis]|uniref:Uncharacterized protein n=3 Tax=Paratrimastix pyriformis TaxID=342808 RepID=A0ABQ8U5T7_9EUKA|nr:hypothetical protein PAPYR_12730 [Paratrimastix pyriformis]
MPKESTQELRETRSGRRYPTPRHSRDDSSEEEPRGHSRKRARAEPKSSAADAAPASPLRLDTVTEDEAEQEETQRASQEHEATEQEQEEIQHASQDADQHHPVVFIPSAEHSSSSEHARASVLPEPPTAEPEAPEPEQTTVPEQTTEPVPEQTTIEPGETTTTEPEVTTSDPVQATTTEPAEPSEPEPAQSELQQTGTEPEAAEQSVPGEPEQLAEPEQPAEPELTPNPSRPQPLLRRPQSSPPNADRPSVVVACPSSETEGGFASQETARLHPAQDASTGPRLSRGPLPFPDIDPGNPAFTAAAGCWFNRCSQDASASGIRAFQNPTCSPCRVLRLTCSPGHRHEHYCHASSSGSGSGFRASQNPTCSPGHRHEHDCHASSSGSGSGFRASQNPTCSPGHRHEHDCKASSSGSGSSFRASQNAPHRHEFHVISPSHKIYLVWQSETKEVLKLTRQAFYERIFPKLLASWFPSTNHLNRGLIVPVHFFETMAEYRLSGAICVEMHKVLNRLGLTFGKILFSMTCGQSADIEKTYHNFVMMHAEIKRNDDPFLRFLNRDISEKHLRYTDLDSDFKVLTQKMLPELAKLFGYITVHKQRVVSRALLKTIVEMLGSLEREMLVSSMTDFFYQVLGSVTWHAGQSDLESISSESPPSPKSLSGSKKGRAANPLRSPLCTPCGPGPFGNPFAHQPAAPTAPSTPVPDPVVAKPPASSRTPAPASAKGFLTSRALMILVCLDSEAAFGVDRAVDGHMRLDELALWERTFPFYVKEVFHDRSMLELTDYYGEQFPKVFQACEREYLALSEDERKTYDWSIQCHKFRTNTCYREIPAHWDCLFKFTGNA